MKRFGSLLSVLAMQSLLALSAAGADAIITGLSDQSHISGPAISPKELQGKVVLVEFWGLNCPPCIASLPHMQDLYEKYSRRGNFMLIGSHSQMRDDEKILALLKAAKVTYPVYQFARVTGMPAFSGIPHAAIIDHKGKFVTSGKLREMMDQLPKIIQAAPLPIPGSLLDGMEVKHHKGIEQRLVVGQNVEPLLKQLRTEAVAETDAGREAAALVKQCEAALAERERQIREQLATAPSQALEAIAAFSRTCPSQAAPLAPELARLNASPEVKKLQAFRKDLGQLSTLNTKSKSAAKNAAQQATFKKRYYAPLCESADAAVQSEAKTLAADLDAMIEQWNAHATANN